jgi:hypothetical protein
MLRWTGEKSVLLFMKKLTAEAAIFKWGELCPPRDSQQGYYCNCTR